MKKTLLILAALLCGCFALKAQEIQDFTYENLNYHVTGTNPPTVELAGHTEGFTAHDLAIPSTVTYEETDYSVTSIGYEAFYRCTNLTGSLTIPNSVTSIGNYAFDRCSGFTGSLTIGNSVTSIGTEAFYGCSGFTGSLTIGSSVESIGKQAFDGCSGFTGSLTIPNSVTSIGEGAFYLCSGFTGSLTIGSSVTSIGKSAFYWCSGFTGSLTIPNSVTSIGANAFYHCSGFTGSLTIGNSVTSIEEWAFFYCSGFTGSLTIGNSVESIGEWAWGFTSFAHIIAKPVTPPDLGDYALGYASDVHSIFVPCGSAEDYKGKAVWSDYKDKIEEDFLQYELTVTSANPEFGSASITQQATCEDQQVTVLATPNPSCLFTGWTENGAQVSTANPYTFTLTADRHLVANYYKQYDFSAICTTGQTLYYRIIDAEQNRVKIVAPNGDNANGWSGFANPTGQIELPENVEHGGTSYTVTAIGDCAFYGRIGLTGSLSIPNSVTSIEGSAFQFCDGFTGNLIIPNSVTSIGNYAFAWCSGFTGSLTIGNSVESIGKYAFYNCPGFTGSLTIPNSVTSIGDSAFANCSGFTGSLTIPNSVKSIGTKAFSGCSEFTDPLTIGSSVTSIENRAFEHTHIAQIVAKPTTPPAMYYDNAFLDMLELQTIFVPCGSVDAYKTSLNDLESMIEGRFLEYDLTVTSSNPDFGSANITQIAACENHQATVTATPAGINRFTGWMENGVVVSTDNPYSFTLTSDRNLVANFVECVNVYEPVMSMPSPIDPDAVYVLGYQDGDDYYLHTSGEAAGEMRLSKNPENPIKYSFTQMGFGISAPILKVLNENNFFAINSDGVFLTTTFDILNDPYKYYISIQAGDISSQSAPTYTAYHDGDIIRSHEDSSEGNLRLFEVIVKPLYHIAVSSTPEGLGTATATCGGETVESALEGTNITVSATPNEGCKFVNWTENDEVVSTANPYTFTLNSDRNLVANFFRQYDFSAACTTGQTLYYRIIDAEQHLVSIVAPNNDDNYLCWNNFTKPTGSIELPETVEHDGTSYTVAEINSYAFYRCDGLTGSLTIPNSVISIGNDAFYNCTGFNGSLTIGNAVTNIGNNAFNQCSSFTGSLDIPNSVTSIGNNAFKKCEGFTGSLTIGNSVTGIGQQAFENCSGFNGSLTIGNAVTSIGATAFNGCTNFTGTLTIGSSVTSIGNYAFFNCSGFTHIIAKPATPPTLGTDVFDSMSELQFITVPCGKENDYKDSWSVVADKIDDGFVHDLTVTSSNPDFGMASITQQATCENPQATVSATPNPSYIFTGWTENGVEVSTENPYSFTMTTDRNLVANFTVTGQYDFSATCTSGQKLYYKIIDAEKHWVSIVAPNGDNANGWSGFNRPTGEIMLPETVVYDGTNYTVTAIGDCAFYECDGLTGSLNIPNSVASIGVSAFEACSGFAGSLTIGNSVTSIGNDAFYLCLGFIGSLIIPNSVKNIGNEAFESCVGFTGSLTIGSSVENIGQDAFWRCNFTNIISKARTAPTLDSEIPDASHKVYIPKNTTNSYEDAWTGHDYTFIEYEREDYHFNGTGNVWNTAANWEENEVPSLPCHNVFINTNCIFNATGINASVHSVNVATGKTLTIAEGKTLTADLITLEDGAQLVNNGTIICDDLTVKKAIEGYGTGAGNWYLISSPVATTSLPVGMKADPAEDYDLYRFSQTGDEEGREWLNYKAESFGIENQNGYLYACKNDTTIIFRGGFAATGTKELEYDEGEGVDFPGFNLVGNPYPCNATISGTNLRSSNYYYKMNAAGTDLEVVAEPVLAPYTGVFAVAANDQATVTFTQADATANVTRGEKSSLQDIRVELLANGKVIDRAYLNMNSESLSKFRLQDNISEICFYQNKEELAVASTGSAHGEMPLNFKAEKNGSYTINVNVGDVDLNYLHLVDNLTGADVDLLATASTGSANYTFDAKTSDYASRFKLVFGVKDETSEASENFAFISNGEIIVSNEGRATLQLIDVMGRIVSSEEINGECRISTNGLTAGLYILNLDGRTQKIVVR